MKVRSLSRGSVAGHGRMSSADHPRRPPIAEPLPRERSGHHLGGMISLMPERTASPSRPIERGPAGRHPWVPERVLLTPGALRWEHGRQMAERAALLGSEVVELAHDRLPRLGANLGARAAYREAKSTLAVVVAAPGKRRPQPIPPSADWRFDLAEGCPAHCQYCYLAGSLKGPPLVRAYANLPEILRGLQACAGAGTVTSA